MRLRVPVKRLKLSSLLCFTIKFTTIREAIDVRDLEASNYTGVNLYIITLRDYLYKVLRSKKALPL